MWRSPKVSEVLPVLYLRGLSTGDFREALPLCLGEASSGLSPTNIARMTAAWKEDYQACEQVRNHASQYAEGEIPAATRKLRFTPEKPDLKIVR